MPIIAHYARMAWSRWRLIAAIVLACTAIAWGVSVFVLARNPTYQASARLNIVPTSEELGYASRFVRGSTFDGGSVLLQTYAEFAHTRPVVDPIVDRYLREAAAGAGQDVNTFIRANSGGFTLTPGSILSLLNYGAAPVKPLRDDIAEELIENTLIETVEGTYLLRLTVTWEDAKSAAWFANALADAITARAERMSRATGQNIAGSLEERLRVKQQELSGVLRQAGTLKAATGVVDIDQQKQALLAARVAEQSQLTSDRAALEQSQAQVAGLRRQNDGKLSSAQAVLEQTLATEAPRASGLAKGVGVRQGRVSQIEAQLAALARNEVQIKAYEERARQLQAEVAALTERVSFSQTENIANAPRIQLIERATPPLTRSTPKIFFNSVLGFIAGCALAGCLLLLLGEKVRVAAPEDEEPVVADVSQDEPVVRPIETDAPAISMLEERAAPAPVFARPEPVTFAQHRPVEGNPGVATHSTGWVPTSSRTEGDVIAPRAPAPAASNISPFRTETGNTIAVAAEAPAFVRDQPTLATQMRTVASSVPAPDARLVDDTLVYSGVLQRPTGPHYDVADLPAVARPLAKWLMGPLSPDGRPLVVGAVGDERDAKLLLQVVTAHLRAAGFGATVIDAATDPRAAMPADAGKPIVYVGSLATPERRALLSALGDAGEAVIAVDVPVDADRSRVLSAQARMFRAIAGRAVHVVAIAG